MKYAILGDIHANLEALQAVLEDARNQQATHYVCLGDVVGYNADPVECLRLVRDELKAPVVRGNHDHYCSHPDSLEGFHPLAADVVDWTRQQLSSTDIQFLKHLPYSRQVESFTVVHSTLDTPESWGYVFDKLEAEASFSYQTTPICFYGHTHVPIAFIKTGSVQMGKYSKIKVSVGRKLFINAGSVGQPRDGDPRAAYVLYDLINNEIELRRIPYDIEAAQRKVRAAGLPERIAARLALGR